MNSKAMKVCTLTGGVLLTAGIVLSIIGLEVNGAGSLNARSPAASGASIASSAEGGEVKGAQDVRNLDLSSPVGDMTIKTGERFTIELGKDIEKYVRYEVKDGTFRMWDPDSGSGLNWFGGSRWWNGIGYRDVDVTLTVPADAVYDRMDISLGAGELDIEGVSAKQADFSAGAGSMRARDLAVSEKFVFSAGVGESDLEGDFTGDIEISGGVGSTRLVLARPRADYNISTSIGVGSVSIDGREYSFLERDLDEDNGADNHIDISGGVGEIDVQFENGQIQ